MNLCRHCQRRVANRSRNLCAACYQQGHVRRLYPAETRQASSLDGNCRHCGKYTIRLKPRRLCYLCYRDPAISALYPSESKFAPKHDDYEITLEVLDCYPNLATRQPCGCGRGWDGECVSCERAQRLRLPARVPEPETAAEIIAFVRSLRRPCGVGRVNLE